MQSIEKIVLIGSGNVATELAVIFIQKGLKIVQVYSPNLKNAELLASASGCDATNILLDIREDADLYIIAIKDDAISELNTGLRLPGKIVVHTSGSAGLNAIQNISDKTGVFYPLQTFTKNRQLDWKNIPVILESSDASSLESLKSLAGSITDSVFEINSENRKKLHLAAVFASNFINHILGQSKGILGEDIPFNILQPLVNETVSKAFELGPDQSQTGPAKRRDMKTIEAHIELLKSFPEAEKTYRMFTDFIIRKYKDPGTND